MARLAWFSPVPPVRSGIAACSADLLTALADRHAIDVFVDEPVARTNPQTRSAHDFLWRHAREPYDLTVYQLGNSSHHDYLWPYLFRVPGLVVLHDVHLHHARAADLLRRRRTADYRAEFAANHPAVDPAQAEVAVAGFDTHLAYAAPMLRLVAQASRLTAVHAAPLLARLAAEAPGAAIDVVRLGHGNALPDDELARARRDARAALGLSPGAVVFGIYGGLTPEKRIPQILDAFRTVLPYAPTAHLLLAGAAASHYDVAADAARRGLAPHVTLTGYLDDEAALTSLIAAADVGLHLRWPTARELSGPWLRSLALGRATVITDLVHLVDVPTLDPRTWRTSATPGAAPDAPPVAVSIDITDEAHSLRLALRRLATDEPLRAGLGAAASAHWQRHHTVAGMAADYDRVIARALTLPAPAPPLPAHLTDAGDGALHSLLAALGTPSPLR